MVIETARTRQQQAASAITGRPVSAKTEETPRQRTREFTEDTDMAINPWYRRLVEHERFMGREGDEARLNMEIAILSINQVAQTAFLSRLAEAIR